MSQAVAIVESELEPEPLPAAAEPAPFRYGVPLLLAAGWGALFAFSAAFLMDEARVDAATASAERAAMVEPAAYAGLAEPIRAIAVSRPVPRWDEAEVQAPAPEPAKEPAAIRNVALASPDPVPAPAPIARSEGASAERADFIGTWGPTAFACGAKSRRRGYLPATITEGARAGSVLCRFRNGRRDGVAWTTTADCSERGRRWTSQVRLVVDGDRLTWTSGKGPSFYVRCGRRDG